MPPVERSVIKQMAAIAITERAVLVVCARRNFQVTQEKVERVCESVNKCVCVCV